MNILPCNLKSPNSGDGERRRGTLIFATYHSRPSEPRPNCGWTKQSIHSQQSKLRAAFAQFTHTFTPGCRISLCLREKLHSYSFKALLCSHVFAPSATPRTPHRLSPNLGCDRQASEPLSQRIARRQSWAATIRLQCHSWWPWPAPYACSVSRSP